MLNFAVDMSKTAHNNTTGVERAQFATRLGALATTVGSAVGLGNIWRFPYEAGVHGGGAFMLCYIAFIVALGIPVLCAEFVMGRETRSNVFGAFRSLAAGTPWYMVGYIGIFASLLILGFYSVVAGWTIEYFWQSLTGGLDFTSQEQYHEQFDQFSTGAWRPLLWTVLFLTFNFIILVRGVTKGIEKMSNLLMPVLFALLVLFCINSLTMDKALEGLEFLFRPDFSQITPSVLLGAMGQAFFSISIGLGCMMTYASYFRDSTHIGRGACLTASLDTLVAILAGVIIFPAVFTFGMSPAAGPRLVFEVLPSIFHQMPAGVLWSTLFFFLLFLASLTSTISMSEISIAFFVEEKKMTRRGATILNFGIALVLGAVCALSFGCLGDLKICGLTMFNLFDYLSSNILLPLGGMLTAFFAGWILDVKVLRKQLSVEGHTPWWFSLLRFAIRFIAPIGIALIFLHSIGLL